MQVAGRMTDHLGEVGAFGKGFIDQARHLIIFGNTVIDRYQRMSTLDNSAVFNINIQSADERAVTTRLYDHRVPDPFRLRQSVVGMAAQNNIDLRNLSGQLDILGKAQV